jgi:hypothetical protein
VGDDVLPELWTEVRYELAVRGAKNRRVATPAVVAGDGPEAVDVHITFYACDGDSTGRYCGTMANGRRVHEGAAACGYAFDLGQGFRIVGDPTGREYVCEDRGRGGAYWVDIWFQAAEEGYAWLAQVGSYGRIVLRRRSTPGKHCRYGGRVKGGDVWR